MKTKIKANKWFNIKKEHKFKAKFYSRKTDRYKAVESVVKENFIFFRN